MPHSTVVLAQQVIARCAEYPEVTEDRSTLYAALSVIGSGTSSNLACQTLEHRRIKPQATQRTIAWLSNFLEAFTLISSGLIPGTAVCKGTP